MEKLISILLLFFALTIRAQGEPDAKNNFTKLKKILSEENNSQKLLTRLDSLKLTFQDQRTNSVNLAYKRDIDFNFFHQRIIIYFDFFEHRIDLVVKNDSIYLKSLNTQNFKKYSYRNIQVNSLVSYLKKRNEFYKSNKKLSDLLKEVSSDQVYGQYCGESLGLTDEAVKIERMAEKKDFISLGQMLTSFNCEEQSFGVLGFSIIEENGNEIPFEYQTIIQHIKSRNSELQICRGCIYGIFEKIY